MSVHGDVCSVLVLANVAGGNVYPEFLPEEADVADYVIVRRVSLEPVNTLQGYGGITKSTMIMECWARDGKAAALAIADAVYAAIDASTALPIKIREPISGEQFEPAVMEVMEPVQYGIWHP